MENFEWITKYESPTDPRLGVCYDGSNISANDGDVCISVVTHFLIKDLQKPYCLDIGADECWWAIFCVNQNSSTKVDAFEPMPISKAFQDYLQLNYPSISLHNKAVSNEHKTLPICKEGPSSHSRMESDYKVEAITLDDFLKSVEKVDIIKIDTEGHELQILQNLLKYKEKLNAIIFEFSVHWYADELYEAIDKTYTILSELYTVLPYSYYVSRRGPPELLVIQEDEILPFIKKCFNEKNQCDLVFLKNEFKT